MTVYRRATGILFAMSALLSLGAQAANAEPGHSIGLRHEHVRPESAIDDMPTLKLAIPPTSAYGVQSGPGRQSGPGKVIMHDILRKPALARAKARN